MLNTRFNTRFNTKFNTKPTHARQTAAVLALLCGLLSGASHARQVGAGTASAALEEVIVTATKREKAAQDVGKSINVFGSEALDRAGVDDVSRLALITPGLAFAQRGNDFKLTLRGANSENTDRAEPVPIGVFVDGVYRVRAAQGGNAFLDVASVEVLKGPQGTLFGRNTLGGAVLVKTRRPDSEANDYGLQFGVDNYHLRRAQGFANWAVAETFALRVAALWAQSDGWIENLGAGNDLGELDDRAMRISARWDVSDRLSALLSHFSYDSGGSALGAYGYQSRGTLRDPNSSAPLATRATHAFGVYDPVNPRGGAGGSRDDLGPWRVYRDGQFIREVREETTLLELQWNARGIDIQSLTSFTDYRNVANVDGDYSEGRLLEESRLDDMQAYSQEFLVNGVSNRLDWVAGLYAAGETFTQAFFRTWLGFAGSAQEAAQVAAGTLSVADLAACGAAFNPNRAFAIADPGNPRAVCPGQFAGNPADLKNNTFGAFAHGTFSLSDAQRIYAGIRYSENKMDYLRGRILRSSGVLGETVPSGSVAARRRSWDQVTWELGFEMDLFADSLLYGSVSTGFLAGSFNPNGSTFDQQQVLAYEIGLKNRLLNDRVEFNISAYRNEFTDMLAGVLDAQSLTVKVNGGSINANGIELDLTALPTDRLKVVANLTFQDSKYDEFGAVNRFQTGGTGPAGFVDLSGRETPWAPKLSGNLNVSYAIATTMGLFTPYAQLAYSGAHWTTGLQQFPLARQDAYSRVDLRLYWQSTDAHWKAQLYVENATEEEVLQHTIVGGSDIIQVSWGRPRIYGLRIGYDF